VQELSSDADLSKDLEAIVSITASAPGKLMLLGEHAVVYGYPCLVTAVDLRVSVTIEKSKTSVISIETPKSREDNKTYLLNLVDLQTMKDYDRHNAFVVASIQKVFLEFKIDQGLIISTQGPSNSFGLGSSSAVTVATVFALSQLFDLHLDKRHVFELAYSAVLDVQKVGSGYDVASAVYGGTIYYQPAKTIEPLPVTNWPISIGYSGQKVSTTYFAEQVKQLRAQYQGVVDMVFKTIGDVVYMAKLNLEREDWMAFGKLMDINQGLLASLGVSTINLEKSIYAARAHGAYGAKLSGAGGGDCMYALVNATHQKNVERAISSSGATIVPYKTNAVGVRID
jgi:mevalonate kinase